MADEQLLNVMRDRRDSSASLVLLHGVWSTGAGWYPFVITAFQPFFEVTTPLYDQLATFEGAVVHFSVKDETREQQFQAIASTVLSQLPHVLEHTGPEWLGPKPSVIAHSYGSILLYRFMHSTTHATLERVLFRGAPIRNSVSFQNWKNRTGGIHSIVGGQDFVVRAAGLLKLLAIVHGQPTSSLPPHFGSLGYSSGPLGSGHFRAVDGDDPETWECIQCPNGREAIHTWEVPIWDHTTVSKQDVFRYWFPLLLGWEPRVWDRHKQAIVEMFESEDSDAAELDLQVLERWLSDRELRTLWHPYDTAGDTIRAAIKGVASQGLAAFQKSIPDYEIAIGALYATQVRRALRSWYGAPVAMLSPKAGARYPRPNPNDLRRALLPEALTRLSVDVFARWWLQRQ